MTSALIATLVTLPPGASISRGAGVPTQSAGSPVRPSVASASNPARERPAAQSATLEPARPAPGPLVGSGTPLPILAGATWAYFKGTVEPPASWNTIAFDDSSWLTGPSGFGYGDGDDATVLSDMQNGYLSVYTRRQFDVPNPAAIAGLELTVNWDDGFVAFVNGQEVARRNLAGTPGTPVAHDIAASSHEAGTPETIPISSGMLVAGTNVIAVQCHNTRLDSTDLTLIVELRATNPPPASPAVVSPTDGATGVSLNPNLCVGVSDPNDTNLNVSFYGRPVTASASAPFTIIALPDTQYYAESYPATYTAQTQWILDNLASRNIAFVTQLGDCVNVGGAQAQWINADTSWDIVENPATTGLTFGIPYGIAVGNHDQDPIGDPGTAAAEGSTTTLYNTYFGQSRFAGRSYYGGHYGINNDNHYELFEAGGMEFIDVHIEYMPTDSPLRQAVLAWADGVLQTYANRRAIVTSHYLINPGDASWGNQGQATWDALKHNHNLFMMLCGHLDQANRRYDEYTDGSGTTRCHTMVSDYQTLTGGGNGWLRILTFHPDSDTIDVETYSPTLDVFIDNHPNNTAGTPKNHFTLDYDMVGGEPFALVGSASGTSGSQVCVPWSGRQASTQYEWYAVVSDGVSSTSGAASGFTTGLGSCNLPADCNDGNPCTQDDCVAGTCQFSPIAGCCVMAADCDDNDTCTDDTCNAGTCQHTDNTAPCDDGNGCTVSDLCAAGLCAGVPNSCDDGNACTNDSCVAGACVNTYSPSPGCCTTSDDCDDGVLCSADSCQGGNCVNTANANCCDTNAQCDDGEICTTDTCSPTNLSGLSFNGSSSYVTMGVAPGLGLPQFTIETWFNRTGTGVANTTGSGGITVVPLVAKGAAEADGSNVDANYILGINSNVLAADFEDTASGGNHPISGTTVLANNTWYHAAATYDGSTWRLYLNGNLEATLPVGAFTPRFDSIQPFGLGTMQKSANSPGQLGFFAGYLDEVRVWNYARSQAEIQAGMGAQIPSSTGLVGRWGLNEGTGVSAGDSTTPAENGTVSGGASWGPPAPGIGSATCTHAPIANCCHSNAECDDGNACTLDACEGASCENVAITGCCVTDADCNDNNVCTNDACVSGFCQNSPNADPCDDGDNCTTGDVCSAGTCAGTSSGTCCSVAADCDDGDVCTTDICTPSNPSALALHGSTDYLTMGAAPGLGASAFTLEAWVYLNGAGGTGTSTGSGGLSSAIPIVTKGRAEADATNQDMNYFLGIQGGVLAADFEEALGSCVGGSNPGAACYFSCSTTTSTRCSVDSQCPASETCTVTNGCTGGTCNGVPGLNHPVLGTTSVTSGIWHHVAATYDGSCWQLFLDGVTDTPGTTCPGRPPRADSIEHFAIGSALTSTGAAAGFLDGVVDEVRVWNVARTPAQIQASRYQEITSDPNLIGRWGMNENTGTTAFDSTTPTENGSFTGSPSWEPSNRPAVGDGTCSHAPVANCCHSAAECDDGNLCTTDACTANACTHTAISGCCQTVAECDDGNVCTDDACTNNVCSHTPNNAPCSDGDACTTNDACVGGMCVATVNSALCDDGNVCTADSCIGGSAQYGLSFDGTNDYVTFGNATELGLSQFTIETWFKKTGAGIGNTTGGGGISSLIPLVTKGAPEADGSNVDANYIFGINTTGNVLAADFEDTATGGNHPISGTTAILDNTWYHAAATYDGTTWRLYLNGNLEATLVVGAFTPRFDSVQHAGLGAMLTSTGTRLGAFQGVLDEVRIWNYARSGSEIAAAKSRQITTANGLVARWGLNDGAGGMVGDSTSPASNGTLTNFDLLSAWVAGPPSGSLQVTACAYANQPNGTACTDDGNPCTSDTCNSGSCAHPAGNNGASCSDGNACTANDLCGSGSCSGSYAPVPGCCATSADCNDGNPYTSDSCSGGNCTNALATNCATSADCNDGNSCTTDTCVGGNVSALQFDGTNDYVTMGAAAGTSALGATTFTLETWFNWTGSGVTTTTGTGGIANLIPLVTKGAAQAETPANLNANYLLGISGGRLAGDFEDTAGGLNHPVCTATTQPTITTNVWHHAAATYNGTCWALYLDGVALTIDTSCSTCSGGACTVCPAATPESTSIQHFGLGTTLTSTGTAAGFYQGRLDEVRVWNVARSQAQIQASQYQEITSAPNLIGRWGLNDNGGTSAADSTTPAENGTLTNGPAWSPTGKAPLTSGTCQRTQIPGCCNTNAECSDGNACNGIETCSGGTCQPGTPVVCNDSNACTDDTCSPATGCVFTNNSAPCSDNNACTSGDVCNGGSCQPGTPVVCNDSNSCTDDTCSPATGCVFTNNTASCDDGDACTTGDVCGGGTCHAGAPVVCDDSNPCTDDSCSPSSGCVYTADDTNLGPVSCGIGVCERTVPGCAGGVLQTCVPGAPTGSDADCNGADENCNGTADENYIPTPTSCGGPGVCAGTGQLACVGGSLQDTCTPGVPATANVVVAFGSATRYRANSASPTEDLTLVAFGSPMHYVANTSDPGVGLSWVSESFDDSAWDTGSYGVGYEDTPPGATDLLQTTVPSGTYSVYTRASFTVSDLSAVTSVAIGADYDDGWIAWINGVEVARSSTMPAGSPSWNTNAGLHESSNGAAPNYGTLIDVTSAALPLLHNGSNTLAVGVWNSAALTSSDLVLVPKLAVGLDWTREGYDDSSWPVGTFGIGYETAPPGAQGLLGTTVPSQTSSVFTRTTFDVANPAAVQRLLLGADYDDGFVAWINGVEVYGSHEMGPSTAWNAPSGSHESSNGAVPNYGSLVDISAVGIPALHAGTNVLAVGVWNVDTTSTDLVLVPRLSLAEAETCDGLDNDCNGIVDEGFPDHDGDGIKDCVDPDDDGDGVADDLDCAPLDPGRSAGPLVEVSGVVWGLHPNVMGWTELGAGVRYDVVGGTISALRTDGGVAGASCLRNDAAFGVFDDTRPAPPPGEGYYYIVRAQKDSCGDGTYGSASSGAPRTPASDCP